MKSNTNSPTIEHARQERDKCAAYEGPDVWGAFLGWADWSVEVKILEARMSPAESRADDEAPLSAS